MPGTSGIARIRLPSASGHRACRASHGPSSKVQNHLCVCPDISEAVLDGIRARLRATKALLDQAARADRKRAAVEEDKDPGEQTSDASAAHTKRSVGRPSLVPVGMCKACTELARKGRASVKHTYMDGCSRA